MGSNSARTSRCLEHFGWWACGTTKRRSLPHSCEGSYQLVPWIDLFNWMFCFQIRQSRNLPFVSHKSCTHIHVDARERAREQSKERSGVRVQTESETGERHTPHGRVKPNCLARKYRSGHRFAPCIAKPILRKVWLFCSLRGLLTRYSDLNEILS